MRSCWCRLPNPLPPLPTELPPPAGRGRGDEPPPSTGPKPAWPAGLQSSAEGCRLPSAEGGTVSGRAGAPGHCPSHPGRAPTHLPCRTGLSRRCWGSSQKGRGRRPCCSRHLSWGSTPAGREASALRQAGPGGPGLTYPRSAGSRQVLPSHRKAIYPPSQLPPAQNSLSLLNPANFYGSLKAQPGHPGPFFLPAAPARTTQIRGPQSQDPGRPSAWAAPGQGTQRAPGTSANSNRLAPPGAEGWVWGGERGPTGHVRLSARAGGVCAGGPGWAQGAVGSRKRVGVQVRRWGVAVTANHTRSQVLRPMEPDRTSDANPEPGPGVAGASLQDSARPGGPGGPGGWRGSQEERTGQLPFPCD